MGWVDWRMAGKVSGREGKRGVWAKSVCACFLKWVNSGWNKNEHHLDSERAVGGVLEGKMETKQCRLPAAQPWLSVPIKVFRSGWWKSSLSYTFLLAGSSYSSRLELLL